MGLSLKFPVVHCHTLRKIERSDIVGGGPLGQAPAGIMSAVIRATQREASEQAYEERMAFVHATHSAGCIPVFTYGPRRPQKPRLIRAGL